VIDDSLSLDGSRNIGYSGQWTESCRGRDSQVYPASDLLWNSELNPASKIHIRTEPENLSQIQSVANVGNDSAMFGFSTYCSASVALIDSQSALFSIQFPNSKFVEGSEIVQRSKLVGYSTLYSRSESARASEVYQYSTPYKHSALATASDAYVFVATYNLVVSSSFGPTNRVEQTLTGLDTVGLNWSEQINNSKIGDSWSIANSHCFEITSSNTASNLHESQVLNPSQEFYFTFVLTRSSELERSANAQPSLSFALTARFFRSKLIDESVVISGSRVIRRTVNAEVSSIFVLSKSFDSSQSFVWTATLDNGFIEDSISLDDSEARLMTSNRGRSASFAKSDEFSDSSLLSDNCLLSQSSSFSLSQPFLIKTQNTAGDGIPIELLSLGIGVTVAFVILLILAGIVIRAWCYKKGDENQTANYETEAEFPEETLAVFGLDNDSAVVISVGNSDGELTFLEEWDVLQFNQSE
jgi:hypothetical protein